MKNHRKLPLLSSILVVILIFMVALPRIVFCEAAIAFDHEQFDFGTVEPSETLEHTFEFVNNGSDDLVIERIVTT